MIQSNAVVQTTAAGIFGIGFYMFGATWSTNTNWIAAGPTMPLITASAEL
jgi:hypothetical protein